MQLSGGGVGAGNVHAGWRMAVARRAAEAYQGNRNLAAVAVAGSVGAGLADRFSDLELDGYWIGPPTDTDRVAPVHALGGELTHWGEYDQDEEEWSEEYRVGELGVTVSNFLVGSSSGSSTTWSCGQAPIRSGTCAWPRSSARARWPARR